MWNTFKAFLQKHILGTVVSTTVLGLMSGGGATYWALYEAQVNRVAEMRVKEFQSLGDETQKFKELLSSFTEDVDASGTINPDKRKDLSSTLVRMYNVYGAFTVNLPKEKEQPVKTLQTSINEVKKQVQTMKTKQDLDPLGLALVDMFQNLKTVQPLLEEAVGKPTSSPNLDETKV
ncbi:hypothetical protein [Phyllobacterium lublinensis]|uniref:hypothetical protein n=1 Tax=Phyllobacterium lublinensis TaxID=2875708 RepID=UPI001CCA192D|nr:hypothetical protein [Phyllobacterium sp. 2063]MBZ9654659.1 hypothetical protein [Phyllobacterium sp. 2063]